MKCSRPVACGAFALLVATSACHHGGGSSSTPVVGPTAAVTDALWIANGTNVVEYLPTQLGTGTANTVPHLTLTSTAFASPQGVVFDSAGDLWVLDGGNVVSGGLVKPALYKFTAAQLKTVATTPSQTPSITINVTNFVFPQQAVFDKNGNLWVSDDQANAVFQFSTTQLLSSNTGLVPNTTLTSATAFNGPLGIALDASGDLYVANNGGTSIQGFNASVLPGRGVVTLTPSVIINDNGQNSVQAPWGLAFDADGNLWASNAASPETVVEFAKSSLNGTGSPAPAVTISPATVSGNTTLAAPNGIAFDPAGDLAVMSSATPFGVAIYSHGQLTGNAALVPPTFIVGSNTTLSAPAGAVFGPLVN
jgi:secreted PhoX family phosphatase